jgi:hypothetical protein
MYVGIVFKNCMLGNASRKCIQEMYIEHAYRKCI